MPTISSIVPTNLLTMDSSGRNFSCWTKISIGKCRYILRDVSLELHGFDENCYIVFYSNSILSSLFYFLIGPMNNLVNWWNIS